MVSMISISVTLTIQYNPRLIPHLTILPMSFCIENELNWGNISLWGVSGPSEASQS